jgi:hypothetical protein
LPDDDRSISRVFRRVGGKSPRQRRAVTWSGELNVW